MLVVRVGIQVNVVIGTLLGNAQRKNAQFPKIVWSNGKKNAGRIKICPFNGTGPFNDVTFIAVLRLY